MARTDGRKAGQLRPAEFVRKYTMHAPGSVLVRTGNTAVLCTAFFEEGVPRWRAGQGKGWVTAEYEMLPSATNTRRRRNRGKLDGRTQEIQRLIGRSLRAVVDMDLLGEHSILLDCDVLQADGGTRTASVTGAYVALVDCVRHAMKEKMLRKNPIREAVAAVSVGQVAGRTLLDLDYSEDSTAQVDMNVVMTESGRFIEVQGTGEGATFSRAELDKLIRAATRGIKELLEWQRKALRRRMR